MSGVVTLFGLERSVYTRIARLALEEKGVMYQLQKAEIFGHQGVPEEHLQRHPFGRIPVLQHGNFLLYETAAITRYVDEAFPGPALQPTEPEQRARLNQIIGILDSYAYRPMVWGVFTPCVISHRTKSAQHSQVLTSLEISTTCLTALQQIAEFGPYLLGPRLSLADLHALPILLYLSLATDGLSVISQHPAVFSWLQSMLRRPSVVKTRSIYESDKRPMD